MSSTVMAAQSRKVPRLGFLGVGWIGRNRMQALDGSDAGTVGALCDASEERLQQAHALVPAADRADSFDALLEMDIDGVVIATPSALHADQAVRALERGVAVFCQKPLARTAAETRRVIAAAAAADRLLGIDLSYRYTAAMRAVRNAVRAGTIGDVFAVDLVFHNAYGPDGGWARDPELAGGGCVIDLGIHLVDLALWTLDAPTVTTVHSQLYAHGQRVLDPSTVCEDYALATLELDTGATVRLACSWELNAGRDAVIEATFHGSHGSVSMHNVDGSFYDFAADRYDGAAATSLAAPPDDWGGRALLEWSRRLGNGEGYDAGIESVVDVAYTLDRILGR